MYTLENEKGNLTEYKNQNNNKKLYPSKKGMIIYLCVSAFCFILYLVYNNFSHGVHSIFMTFLFAIPLVLGAIPCLILWLFIKSGIPNRICVNLWNSGVAAVTCASLLNGIFEIAGAESVYQRYLFYAGIAMLLGGIGAFVVGKIKSSHRENA